MSNSKISALTSATTPLAGTETLPIVQSGVTKQVSIDNILSPASGKGINFSAAGGDTLTMYDEGTFTPTVVGTTTAGSATYSPQVGRYTRVGNRVLFSINLAWSGHTGTGNMRISGLPFTSNSSSSNFHTVTVYHNNMAMTAANIAQTYIPTSSNQIVLDQVPIGGGTSGPIPLVVAVSYFIATGQYEV